MRVYISQFWLFSSELQENYKHYNYLDFFFMPFQQQASIDLCSMQSKNKQLVINLWFCFIAHQGNCVVTALCVKSLNQCPQWRQTLCTALVELGGSDSWLMYFESILCLTCFNFLPDECQSETWQNNNLSLFSLSMWGLIAEGFVVAGNNEHVVSELPDTFVVFVRVYKPAHSSLHESSALLKNCLHTFHNTFFV